MCPPGFEPGLIAYRATVLPLDERHMEPMPIIETGSDAYHAPALPLSYIGMLERVRRIELRLPDWRSDAQPIGHTRGNSGAGGDNRNLFSGLEAQGTAYIPRPLYSSYNYVKLIQFSKNSLKTHLSCATS